MKYLLLALTMAFVWGTFALSLRRPEPKPVQEQVYTGTGTATYTIVSKLNFVMAGAQTYSRNQTVSSQAFVDAAGQRQSGLPVAFVITRPDGTKITLNATTDGTGMAEIAYKFNRKTDPVGQYTITASATRNNVYGQGTLSFTVTK